MENPERNQNIPRQVCEAIAAAGDGLFYAIVPGSEGLAEGLVYPAGPGGRCYGRALDVSAFRIMGMDPGFQDVEARDVPQALINAHRKAFSDGMRLMCPDREMAAYASQILRGPLWPTAPDPHVALESVIVRQFPRLRRDAPPPAQRDFLTSLEHEVRRDFADRAGMLDRPRHDRKNHSNDTLEHFYRFSMERPELIVALYAWQDSIRFFCDRLEDLLRVHALSLPEWRARDPAAESPEQYFDRVMPILQTVSFTNHSITIGNIALFLGGAVAERAGDDPVVSPRILNQGIRDAQVAGVFRRAYDSPYGARKILCPFGATAVRMLTMDLGGEGRDEDSVIAGFHAKVVADRETPKISAMCDAARNGLKRVLDESDAPVLKRAAACPFHGVG